MVSIMILSKMLLLGQLVGIADNRTQQIQGKLQYMYPMTVRNSNTGTYSMQIDNVVDRSYCAVISSERRLLVPLRYT